MESHPDSIQPSALTDDELARYVSSLLDDPAKRSVPRRVTSELLERFERRLWADFDKKNERW